MKAVLMSGSYKKIEIEKNIIDFIIKNTKEKRNICFIAADFNDYILTDKLTNKLLIAFEENKLKFNYNYIVDTRIKKQEMINYIKSHKNYVGFANDGDSDRFGVINENGEYVTPNEIIAILLMHLKKNKKMSGCLVKTVGASLMLDIVAQKLGIEVVETPVGFKHVGEAMRKYNPIIAGEESGGLSIQRHIPEKDGVLANLLVLEAMAYERKSLVQLQHDLKKFPCPESKEFRCGSVILYSYLSVAVS